MTPSRPPRRSVAVGSENRPATTGGKHQAPAIGKGKPTPSKVTGTEKVAVQSVLRVRPFTPGEVEGGDVECLKIDG